MTFLNHLSFLFVCLINIAAYVQRVKIGVLIPLDPGNVKSVEVYDEIEPMIRYAVEMGNKPVNETFFTLEASIETFPFGNVLALINKTQSLLRSGHFVLICPASDEVHYAVLESISRSLNIPFINIGEAPNLITPEHFEPDCRDPDIWGSEESWDNPEKYQNYDISMTPPLYKLLGDFLRRKGWNQNENSNVTFLFHDAQTGMNALQKLHTYIDYSTKNDKPKKIFRLEAKRVMVYRASPILWLGRIFHGRIHGSQRVILDVSNLSNKRLKRFFKPLNFFFRLKRNFHYIFYMHDFGDKWLEFIKKRRKPKFKRQGRHYPPLVNVTFFRSFIHENEGYWNMKSDLTRMKIAITPMGAAAFDAVQVVVKGLESLVVHSPIKSFGYFRRGEIFVNNKKGIDISGIGLQTFGKSMIRHMKLVNFTGLSGAVAFNKFGNRIGNEMVITTMTNTRLTTAVMSIVSKSSTVWNEKNGLETKNRISYKRYEDKDKIVLTRRYKIVTTLSPPYFMPKPGVSTYIPEETGLLVDINDYEGFSVDLIRKLTEYLGKEFQYNLTVLRKFGESTRHPDGTESWSGMIGELMQAEADLAVASLTITRARERVVSFTKPYKNLGISIMILKPKEEEFSVFSFMSPLSTEIWMYIGFVYLGVSVVLFLVSRFSPYEWRVDESTNGGLAIANDFTVYNCLWFTLAAFMHQGTDILSRSMSGRVASSAWWFFTMIIVSSYTANLAAFLTLEKMASPIESVEDLAKQTKIKYGIQGGGSTEEFFKFSTVETYKRMYQFMSSQVPSVYVNTYSEGIQRVRDSKGRYAFLMESTANQYTNSKLPCDTMQVGGSLLNSVGYGIATPPGSPLKDQMNLAILHLQERGELKRLELKWWNSKSECPSLNKSMSDSMKDQLNVSLYGNTDCSASERSLATM